VDGRAVTLSWQPVPEKDVIGYEVYYSKESGQGYRKLTKGAPLTDAICRLKGLTSGSTYYFVVTALSKEGLESGDSDEVFARPEQDTVNEPLPEAPLRPVPTPTPNQDNSPI
jgi:fibronectin type 3 domain-containing protein